MTFDYLCKLSFHRPESLHVAKRIPRRQCRRIGHALVYRFHFNPSHQAKLYPLYVQASYRDRIDAVPTKTP
jgi:hypothetical protein